MPLMHRRPADRAFLRRDVGPALEAGTRPWLIALCRAELAWAAHDWRRCNPDADDGSAWSWGAPPPELERLPHEAAAAGILNLAGKRAAFQLALEGVNPAADAAWAADLESKLAKLDALLARAAAQYHTLRAVVDWKEEERVAA
jgi:hypothetical protein